jgi:hypothetical protein
VAFGDVLYHSQAEDDSIPSWFLSTGYAHESIRKFDNLGFKSGVAAPAWDETKLPCMPQAAFGNELRGGKRRAYGRVSRKSPVLPWDE